MLKLVLLGAGAHSQGNHLPALARYASEHAGEVELAGLCDLRREHAEAMARTYGFAHVYTDANDMLRAEHPDGCIAITPIAATAEIAQRVIHAGVPLLMEKPPGATAAEAHQIVDLVESTGARVMVSMNRRFDPALRAAMDWWGDRSIELVHGRLVRVDRRESEFIYGTVIHPLDAMRAIAGDIADVEAYARSVDGVRWYVIQATFCSGARGILEVLPNAGSMEESYELFGSRARALAGVGEQDSGEVRCWADGDLVLHEEPAQGLPGFVRNGAYSETVEFISALKDGRPLHPSPAEVLQSVELCQQIAMQWA
jgi:myo-inositol 2-dehydrogenase/D-chiro-inositol 1-dehydrogenase